MKRLSVFLIGLWVSVCSGADAPAEGRGGEKEGAAPDPLRREIVRTYAAIVHANYTDCLEAAKRLQARLREFTAEPSAERLAAAREEWITARRPYLQSEVYRYYAGPIDDADGPEPALNAWPLDEGYIDMVEGGTGGIIANVKDFPEITPEAIERVNELDGEKNISCGWHAIEFLLWGQDLSATGPGDRPYTDYTTAPHADRRAAYLDACATLMVTHLTDLVGQWAPGSPGNYRAVFEEGVDDSIERILMGMIFLSGNEMAGERLQVAWDTQEQEDEHSCFSDTTHQDTLYNAIGIENVYLGRYVRTDGTRIEGKGIRDLVRAVAPNRLEEMDAAIAATLKAARKMPVPFDQAILGEYDSPGRKAIMTVIARLEDQATLLRSFAYALQLDIPAEAPGDVAG